MIYIPVWFKLYLHIRINDIYLSLKKIIILLMTKLNFRV